MQVTVASPTADHDQREFIYVGQMAPRQIDLTPWDPERKPVVSKDAKFVVAHHIYGKWFRGDRLSLKDLEGLDIERAESLGAILALKDLPK